MCGICGTTRGADRGAIDAMNAAMRHRGPDDAGTFFDDSAGVALGARRLSVIDVEGGHQPLSNEDGTVWAVLNGEIYNHPTLRLRLAASGHQLSTRSDTEVLVHLYEEFGDDLVHALDGMFAFALWDTRRRKLLLGRDRFGEKPLFYRLEDTGLVFASELTALREATGSLPLDPAALDSFFTFGYVIGPESIVARVRQVPPGHVLVWRQGSAEVRRYWEQPRGGEIDSYRMDHLQAETSALLERSVAKCLVTDVPLGVFLSGGVDSTLVAALAARKLAGRLKTFSVGYEVGGVSELPQARSAAAAIGSEHHELVLTASEVGRRTSVALGRLDQPVADPAFVALHALAEFARTEVTVAVGGEGADELFSGYPRYRWLARGAAVRRAAPAVARAASRLSVAIPSRGRPEKLLNAIAQPEPLELHLSWVTENRARWRAALYGPRLEEFANRDHIARLRPMVETGDRRVEAMLMRIDQQLWLPDDVLAKADRATMLASLELRTPYLDRELAEFAASIDPSLHRGKRLLHRALAEVLPAAARRRRKIAFRVPVAEWMRGPLAPEIERQFEGARIFEDGWFDRGGVRHLFSAHQRGEDWSGVLWPVFVFGVWLEENGSAYG